MGTFHAPSEYGGDKLEACQIGVQGSTSTCIARAFSWVL